LTIGITVDWPVLLQRKHLQETNIPAVAGWKRNSNWKNQVPNYGEKPVIDAI